jgi:hypothetical protein
MLKCKCGELNGEYSEISKGELTKGKPVIILVTTPNAFGSGFEIHG